MIMRKLRFRWLELLGGYMVLQLFSLSCACVCVCIVNTSLNKKSNHSNHPLITMLKIKHLGW